MRFLEEEGWEIVRLEPDSNGQISPEQVLEAVNERTVLVSMMAVNNEVGSILPVGSVCRQLHRRWPQVLIHCDAVQAWCKEPLRLGKNPDVDLMSVSGHKIYAPKGIGALYVKKGSRLRPVSFGGGQEKNIRPGTEGIANACAMGLAAELLMDEREENHKRVSEIRQMLLDGLTKLPDICINSPADGTPYIPLWGFALKSCCIFWRKRASMFRAVLPVPRAEPAMFCPLWGFPTNALTAPSA